MARRAFTLTIINHIHSFCPEALHILIARRALLEEIAILVKMGIISWACDKLDSISSQGSFTPVGNPLEGQFAVVALD
jgi:hypothetical protein